MSVQDDPLVGRVLFVEDNPVHVTVLKKHLQRLGLTCDIACNGLEGLEAVKSAQYDLVLMSIQMPIMNGLQATQLIRVREQELDLPHLPIVALTACAMPGDRESCLDAGMDDYLSKPVKTVDLKNMLRKWLPVQQSIASQAQAKAIPVPAVEISGFTPIELQEGSLSEGKILDMEVLGELFDILEAEAPKLLQEYLNQASESLENIDKAVQENNASNLILPAHYLKSASANVGAMRVSALARQLEIMGKTQKMDEAPACLKSVQSAYAQVEEALRIIIQRKSGVVLQPSDTEDTIRCDQQQAAERQQKELEAKQQLEAAERQRPGTVFRDSLKSGIQGPEMVVIGPGKFLMGNTTYDWEQPIHEVTIAYPFAMGKFPVTFAEYDAFCVATGRSKPEDDGFGRDRRPVINVSWDEAEAYCKWLSEQTGNSYRLPSEAEWEYACRAGSVTDYCYGDDVKSLEQYAWFYANSNVQTHPVGEKLPNAWGLYDMHGNVWEWCQDRWHDNYAGAPTTGCIWEGDSFKRVLRGGSWDSHPSSVRSVYRVNYTPDNRNCFIGVRVASFAFART